MKKATRLICAIVAIAMIFSMAAFAADYESDRAEYTAGQHTYEYWSSLYTRTPNVAAAWIHEADSVNVPVSYMGVQARAFDADKKLIEKSDMLYNDVVTNFAYAAIEVRYTGRMYSQGVVEMYNGKDYEVKECPMTVKVIGGRSASVEVCSVPEDVAEYEVNDRGETYGSLMYSDIIGYEPDLITAVGDNGLSGYVRSNELNIKVKNPKEAMEYMKNLADSRTIPLYDIDGNIIDSFTVKNTKVLTEELEQEIAEQEEANKQIVMAAMNSKSGDYIPALGYALGAGEGSERISGYVSQHDLRGPKVHSPDEAVAYMTGFAGIRFPVHLYDAQGNIIGEFWCGGHKSLSSDMIRDEIAAMSSGHIK